jgi:hypothetical protein
VRRWAARIGRRSLALWPHSGLPCWDVNRLEGRTGLLRSAPSSGSGPGLRARGSSGRAVLASSFRSGAWQEGVRRTSPGEDENVVRREDDRRQFVVTIMATTRDDPATRAVGQARWGRLGGGVARPEAIRVPRSRARRIRGWLGTGVTAASRPRHGCSAPSQGFKL